MTTKRTMGQCHGTDNGCIMAIPSCGWTHAPDCPALYSLQRQPGDEKDALTRLVTLLRTSMMFDGTCEAAIDLISEARGEHRRPLDSVDADFSGLSKAIASAQPLPECRSSGGIIIRNELETLRVERDGANERARMLLGAKNAIVAVFEQKVAGLEHDLAKVTDALLTTQKRMGEVREMAARESREALAAMSDEAALAILRGLRDDP